MRALEDLLNEVRDRESRRYLEEAISAYHVGAFRVAIVAAWIAVAFDLIAQDTAAGRQSATVLRPTSSVAWRTRSTAVAQTKLLTIERNLLKVSHEKFEFIDNRELVDLDRLRDDRHVCAHPAFVLPSDDLRADARTGPGAPSYGRRCGTLQGTNPRQARHAAVPRRRSSGLLPGVA